MSLAAFLVPAAVAYAGIVGPGTHRIDHQLATLLGRAVGAEEVGLPRSKKETLAREQPEAKALVQGLGAPAVVVGRVETEDDVSTLYVLTYGADGAVRSRVEVPLAELSLDRMALDLLRRELLPGLRELRRAPEGAVATERPSPVPAETPRPEPEPPPAKVERAEGSVTAVATVPTQPAPAGPASSLETGLTVGFGLVGRTFEAAPLAVPNYHSSPVGAVRIGGEVRPVSILALGFAWDRALGLTTELAGENAATTLSRWQATAFLELPLSSLALGAGAGFGQRSFAIESQSADRTPDGDYQYVILAGRARMPLGRLLALGASVAFEPVVGGSQPTARAFGDAGRWGLELDGDLTLYPTSWLLVRFAAGWQRFAWSWSETRGSGGATDSYFDGMLSLGVRLRPLL
jgi:hypothetical protein